MVALRWRRGGGGGGVFRYFLPLNRKVRCAGLAEVDVLSLGRFPPIVPSFALCDIPDIWVDAASMQRLCTVRVCV